MGGKSVMMLSNQRTISAFNFDAGTAGEEGEDPKDFSIEESSRISWTPYDTLDKAEQHFSLR